jgi:isopenicillin-N epimerase
MNFGADLKKRFFLEPSLTFLNHGSFGSTPRHILTKQQHWQERFERSPIHFVMETLKPALRQTAEVLGAYIGAQGDDIAFITNATTAVNTVLQSIELEPLDEVLLFDQAYPAVINAAHHVCKKRGATVRQMKLPFPCEDAQQIVEALQSALTDKTRLVVLDHITSATALILPIEKLVALCRQAKIPVCVDGAHAPGMLPLHLNQLDADWYTGNCHKWLWAPKGSAFLWTHKRRQEKTRPLVISLFAQEGYTAEFDWTGTRDASAFLTIGACIDFQNKLGDHAVRDYNHGLAMWARKHLAKTLHLETPAPPTMLASMVTLPFPGEHKVSVESGFALRKWLYDSHQIEVPVYPIADKLYFRISAQIYNERDDYRKLADALIKPA